MDTELSADEILKQKFTIPMNNINGFMMPTRYSEVKYQVDNFEIYDDDTFVCALPKTGTSWTQEMVWLIAHNADFEAAKVDISIRFPFLEKSIGLPNVPNSIELCKNLKRPRFIKTHIPFNLLPKQILTGCKKPKIICVTRNPKDMCTSSYYYCQLMGWFSGSFSEFCKLFLDNKFAYNPCYNHIKSFVNNKEDLNILFLKFEDMKKDLAPVIKKVANFLNVRLSDDKIFKLQEHLSFESMKNNPFVNREPKERNPNQKGHFMRSGKVETFKDDMNENINKQFDDWIENNFKDLANYVYI